MKLSFFSLGLPLAGTFTGAMATVIETRTSASLDIPTFLQELRTKIDQTASALSVYNSFAN